MKHLVLFSIALIVAACSGSDEPLTPEEDCLGSRYREPIGLEIGQRAQFAPSNYQIDADPEPLADEPVGYFEPLEIVTVLDGPDCWALPITSNTAILQQRRFWRVRSESRDLEGWVDEYGVVMTQPTFYFLRPLADDETPLEMGVPLDEALEFEGTVRLSDGLHRTHDIRFDDYGYVSLALDFNAPAGCEILVYRASPESTVIDDKEMRVYGRPVQRFFVEPKTYEFRVGYYWPGPQDCPDVDYTFRIEPLS